MKKNTFFFAMIIFFALSLLNSNPILGQKVEENQHFQLKPKEILNHASRNSMQDINLGSTSIRAMLVPNVMMSEEVKKQTPGIETFDLIGEDGKVFGNTVVSEKSVWINYWQNNRLVTLVPDLETEDPYDHYIDTRNKVTAYNCDYNGVLEGVEINNIFDESHQNNSTSTIRGNQRNGETKRTYRMAIVTTGEFYELNGNNLNAVNAIVISSVAGISAIYLREMAITFTISKKKIYTNSSTDPFDPSGPENRTIKSGRAVSMNFGSNTYDIGHTLHRSVQDDGWDSGGVARLASVCRESVSSGSPAKAQGWSGSFSNVGYSWYSLFGHEIGHMFSAHHTFNGTGNSCTDAISEINAYEIGSGITIMSYNGLCDEMTGQNTPDNGEADNYFHISSLLQMTNHAETIGDCATQTATNNKIPDITANPCGTTIVIPKNTPFYLKGSGTDEDEEDIYYSWEQFDEDGAGSPTQGKIGNAASNTVNAPLFKCFPPSKGQFERYFPDLISLGKGATSDKFQALPKRARTLHFKLVGRDFGTNGGAFGFDDVEVQVANSGPLLVVEPFPNSTHDAGSMMTVNWNPNGSEDLCDKVIIKLSIDKGVSYIDLKKDVSYNMGTTMVQIPGYLTGTDEAILMVSCDDSECSTFFDISNGTFNITSDCDAQASFICPADDIMFDQGDAGLNLSLSGVVGEKFSEISKFVNEPGIPLVLLAQGGTGCVEYFDTDAGVAYISVSEAGTYTFNTNISTAGGFGFVTLFDGETYNNNSPCGSFIASSAIGTGVIGGASARSVMIADLEACHEYRINFYNYTANKMDITGVSGPGDMLLIDPDGVSGFDYGYIAVNNMNNIMAAYSPTADFTSISGGIFTVYGIQYSNDGSTDMNEYIGQLFPDFYQMGDCFRVSDNSFILDVEASCVMQSPTLGDASNCNPDDNTFTQDIVVNFTDLPTMGEIVVSGQTFAITENPQIVSYVSQSNGLSESVDISYSEEPNCVYTLVFNQKENCCNFVIPFSGVMTLCENTEKELDAGVGGENGGTYAWLKDGVPLSESTRMITVTEAGTYEVTVTSMSGCPVQSSVMITSAPLPTLSGISDFNLCENTDITVMVTTDANTLSWKKDETDIAGENTVSLIVSEEGNYQVKAISDNNCEQTLDFAVTEIMAPIVDLGNDKTTCIGNEEIFIGPNGNNYTYSWVVNEMEVSTDPMITITTNTVLSLTVSNEDDCQTTDEVEVTFEPGPTLSIDMTMIELCEGDEVTITATTNAANISWKKDDVIIAGETSTSLNVSENGTYTAHVEGSSGCEVEKQAVVFVHPYPINELANEFIGCEGEMITLEPTTSANIYSWLNASGTEISTNKSVQVTEAGVYELIMTNEFNCATTQSTTVSFTTRPTIDLPSTIDICEGASTTLTATSNGMTYQWEKDGQEIVGETNASLQVSSFGTYTLYAYNGSDCFESASTVVTTRSAPIVDLGSGYTICPGEQISLDAQNVGSSYEWITGESSQTIDVVHPGGVTMATNLTLSVIVTNTFNCATTGETEVLLYPNILAQIDGEMGVCLGDTISLTASGGQLFNWTGEDISSTTGETVLVFPKETTSYSVEVTDTQCSGQTETASFNVEVYKPEEATGGEDKQVILGGDVQLKGSGGVSYLWSPTSTIISGQGTATPTVNPTEETIYTVLITDVHGCEQVDSVKVIIVEDPLALLKHVTIITPNDDGLNDVLEFKGLESFPINTLEIFNRWGEIVFKAKDYQKGALRFDGLRNGKELPADTYFYVLKFDNYTIKERLSIVRPK